VDALGTTVTSMFPTILTFDPLQDYRIERKWSAVGFCSGAIAGLVAITPGSGFVGARESL